MSELSRYLQNEGVDEIQDDQAFCDAERDTVIDYCMEKNFQLSDEDMETIRDRGLEDSFDYWKEMHNI